MPYRRHALPQAVFRTFLTLLITGLVPSCATHSAGRPSSHFALSRNEPAEFTAEGGELSSSLSPFRSPEPDAETLERARQVEAARALEGMWAVVSHTDSLGAAWTFRFWSQHGALTLLSFRRAEQGETRASPVDRRAFLQRLQRELPTLLGEQPREVALTLEREETQWSTDIDTSSRESPPAYARTIPSVSAGTSQERYRHALEVARSVTRLLTVPRGGRSRHMVRITLEDDRIVGWEPGGLDSSGSGPALPAPEPAVNTVLGVLLPFTRGLGDRTVAMTLQGEHRQGEAHPRWLVMEAQVLEPLPPPREMTDFAQEYRELHERIFIEFQDQSREYALLAAGFTLEQIAYAVVGGMVLKGFLVTLRVAAPTIASVLTQGGKGAVRWFRTLLVRAGPEERALLRELWMKVETQGLRSLTAAERQQLSALLSRLEKTLGMPLSRRVKSDLSQLARTEYFALHHPEFTQLLGKEGLKFYQVHHLYPMEYAHLFTKLDINSKANLAGVHLNVHRSINTVWTSVRSLSERMGPREVQQVVDIVNRRYGRWFNRVYDLQDSAALASAEQAALREVAQLKALLTP
jgi:hypothetical protein